MMSEPAVRHCLRCGDALVSKSDGERERLLCVREGCGFVFYDNPTPVVAAITTRGEDAILVRPHTFPEKWFGLVTGFLERGETPEDGVRREVLEELGLPAVLVSFLGVYPFFPMNQLIVAYHLTVDGEVKLGAELAAYKLVPLAKLRPWPFGTGDAVRDFLARR